MEIKVMGIRTRYEQYGEGPDVLLLHGWMCSVETFASISAALSASHRVTVIDFPGFGKSETPPEPWNVTAYAEFTKEFIDAIGIKVCDILAHSFGGRVTLVLASTWPERIRKIVLTGCAGLIPRRGTAYKIKQGVFKSLKKCFESKPVQSLMGESAESIREKVQKSFGSSDYRQLEGTLRETFVLVINQDLAPYLPNIKSPTLLIWGEADTETPLWMGQKMEKDIPNAGLVVYPGASHYAFLDRASEFNKVAAHFLGT